MRTHIQLSVFFTATMAIAGMAQATPTLTASTILSDFNAVIYNNFSSTSDVEGPIVIGGNLSGNSTSFNTNSATSTAAAAATAGFGAVTVYGNASGGPYNIDNSGNVYVGGTNSATFNFNGGHSLSSAPPNTISDFETVLNDLSTTYKNMAANSQINATDNNSVQFNATPNANGVAVFNVDANALDSYAGFKVNTNGASTVVINVDASDNNGAVSPNANFLNESEIKGDSGNGPQSNNNIIWNFSNATAVNFKTQWGGVVLAPNATVTNNTPIEGVLVANNFNGQGELHDYPFTGTLPTPTSPPTTSVSEPSDLALFGSGLIILTLLTGYKRQRG